ncbi:MAG: hypothetical protein IKC64_01135 [Clostridia bacterium]|nr:hypothetical protein [Clostridia bacterium]
MKRIFDNYEPFYNMLLSTTLMSNSVSAEFIDDGRKIIDFIAKAYRLDDSFIELCDELILDDLTQLGRTIDQKAVYAERLYGDELDLEEAVFDIKGDVLSVIERLGGMEKQSRQVSLINPGWFDYSHYKTYQPNVRYKKIEIASSTGNLVLTRQVGILKALGIGCKQDYDRAILRFTQCAYWGDTASMFLLSYVYSLKGNEEKSNFWRNVAVISDEYLRTGITVLPDEVCKTITDEERVQYVYISSICQDVIHSLGVYDINFAFVEAITNDKLDYYEKMNHINNYQRYAWKDITNSSVRPKRMEKLGF